MLDLNGKAFCIFGLNDSGKTVLARHLLGQYKSRAIVYDTLHEYPEHPYDIYQPKDRASTTELETTTRAIIASRQYKLFVIDEANRYCPPKPKPLPQAIQDLIDWRAHYHLACGFIARRPSQLNSDLTELSDYLFIFNLPGLKDTNALNDLTPGLGDAAAGLAAYHYIMVKPDKTYSIHQPIQIDSPIKKQQI